MAKRIQVVVDQEERELFGRQAKKEGISLSAWLRKAGHEKVASSETPRHITSIKELRQFFRECDAREKGKEPDWKEHLEMLEESHRSGRPPA